MHTRKLLIGLVVAGLFAAGFGNTILPRARRSARST